MGVVKLSTAGIVNYQKYSNLLAGNSAPSLGAFDLLETTVLSSSAASVTFSGLSAYASDYQHLQIRGMIRSTESASATWGLVQFNSTALTNRHELRGNGSSMLSDAGLISSNAGFALMPGSSATGSAFAGFVMDILDPFETTKNKTFRTLTGVASSFNNVQLTSGFLNSTTALSSVTLYPRDGHSFVQFSRFSLYGIKAGA